MPVEAFLRVQEACSVGKAKTGMDGITYLANAISDGVETLLTDRYAGAVLAKNDSALLKEALKDREARRLRSD